MDILHAGAVEWGAGSPALEKTMSLGVLELCLPEESKPFYQDPGTEVLGPWLRHH